MIALLGILSVATAWLVTNNVESGVREQGRVITQVLADNSVFLLLVPGDSQLTESTANTLNAFPIVQYAEVLDTHHKPVLEVGDRPDDWTFKYRPVDEITLIHEDGCCWHFVGPVVTTERAPTEVQSSPPTPVVLGYVHVAANKGPVRELIRTIVIADIVAAVLISLIIGMYVLRRINRLTQPLVNLQRVMVGGRQSQERVRAEIEGPQEVREIALVFNELMEFRESQSAELESQVKVRTRQLEYARDEALKAEREKSEFMAMFTHEMKAPLHAMHSYLTDAASQLDFISDKPTAERIRQALGIIGVESHELLRRISQILELRSLESGNARVDISSVDLTRVVKLVDDTLRPLAIANGNALEMKQSGATTVDFDEDKIVQILENVVSNACRFTRDGTVTVSLDCLPHQLTIEVTDTGCGIAEEHHAQLFTPFYQVDMSDTREYAGTGLGLAIVKRMTDLLGGRISLDSAEKRGTRITIRFPLPVRGPRP